MPSRYQKEIEDILEQTGKSAPRLPDTPKGQRGGASRGRRGALGRLVGLLPWRVSPAKLMLISFAVLLVAALLNVFNRPAVSPVFGVGLALFIVAYILFFLPSSRSQAERRWRGRPVDYGRRAWASRLRRWFRL